MELKRWKFTISVLWLIWTVAFLVTLLTGLLEPGALEVVNGGELYGVRITPGLILATTIMMLEPLVMAFLSLTLKDSISRWANVVVGSFYTALSLFDWLSAPMQFAYGIILFIFKIAASVLIVYYAWRSPKL